MKSFVLCLLTFLAASCGSEKDVKTPATETQAVAEAKAPTTRYPHLRIEEINGVPDISKVEITLERTTCLGWCPAYSLTLNGDGTGLYKGKDIVLIREHVEFKFDPQLVRDLLDRFEALDFIEMKHEDLWSVVDSPRAILTLKIDGRSRQFRDEFDGEFPGDDKKDADFHRAFYDLCVLIDDGVKVEQWIGTNEERMTQYPEGR